METNEPTPWMTDYRSPPQSSNSPRRRWTSHLIGTEALDLHLIAVRAPTPAPAPAAVVVRLTIRRLALRRVATRSTSTTSSTTSTTTIQLELRQASRLRRQLSLQLGYAALAFLESGLEAIDRQRGHKGKREREKESGDKLCGRATIKTETTF